MLFSGPLLFHTKIKDEDIEKLKSISSTNQDFRKHLAASINDEFQLSNLDYQKIVDPYLDVYREAFFEWYSNKIGRPKVVSCWINHMKDGEFNPPHIHTNCNFSSVLFLNDLPEEIKLEHVPVSDQHIEVFVDGAVWADWTFDATTNIVTFTVVPPEESLIEVVYNYL